MSKSLKGWRTLIFAAIVAVAGVVQTFDWASVIPQDQKWSGIAMLAVGAIIAALRYITNTPIGEKTEK